MDATDPTPDAMRPQETATDAQLVTKKTPEAKNPKSLIENIEAIVVAIILALVIRQFALEAFKIPTQSMEPTLLGEGNGKKYGDRVLVNKLIYKVSEPKLWDVVVFKYPYPDIYCREMGHVYNDHKPYLYEACPYCGRSNVLRKRSDFIKRLVGLPGQHINVFHGDLYLDGTISRKTEEAQEALWLPAFESDFSEPQPFRDRWISNNTQFQLKDGRLRTSGDTVVRFEFRGGVTDETKPDDGKLRPGGEQNKRNPVGDLRVTLQVKPEVGQGALTLIIVEDKTTYRATIPVEGSSQSGQVVIETEMIEKKESGSHTGTLPVGKFSEVIFANVDDTAYLTIDGNKVFHFQRPDTYMPEFRNDNQRNNTRSMASFEADRMTAEFRSLKLDRDVYYTNINTSSGGSRFEHMKAEGYPIPEDEYFFMGDNSKHSSDGRAWGSVKRDSIVGKAFMIFWPFQPFYSETRIQFID